MKKEKLFNKEKAYNFSKKESKEKKQLLIIGNGFDLQCGLNTTYDYFFDEKFGISLAARIKIQQNSIALSRSQDNLLKDERECFKQIISTELNKYFLKTKSFTYGEIKNQVVKDIEKYLQSSGKINKKLISRFHDFSKWDIIFFYAGILISEDSLVDWNNIETMIYNIVTWLLVDMINSIKKSLSKIAYPGKKKQQIIEDLNYNFAKDFSVYNFSKNIYLSNKYRISDIFRKIIHCVFPIPRDNDVNTYALSILKELNIFEEEFSDFINNETGVFDDVKEDNKLKKYYSKADKLLDKLLFPNIFSDDKPIILDVLNFNYSLNGHYARKIDMHKLNNNKEVKIHSWTNIHGVANYKNPNLRAEESNLNNNPSLPNMALLPAPIFGIDNHGILSPDNRKFDNDRRIDLDDPRAIFTKSFRLLDNHVNSIRNHKFQDKVDVITFFGHSLSHADYSYFESIFDEYQILTSDVKLEFYYYPGNNKEKSKEEERKAIKKVVKLLTSYGENVGKEGSENIVNRLVLEQRLSVLPDPKLN